MPQHTLAQISDHEEKGLARIFAIGEQNTRVNHPEQSGYFSGACGIEYYGGELFSPQFRGNVFTADVVLNLIHRDVLVEDGPSFTARRGRPGVEFLASTDRAFRPVNIKTGTDGALYIVDMHREVIEHPEWIPDELEVDMDLKAGTEQGRIYRVIPREGTVSAPCMFDNSRPSEILEILLGPNQFCRLMAQEAIVSQQMMEIAPLLHQRLPTLAPEAHGHALWCLQGLGLLTQEHVLDALRHPSARMREQGLILSEQFGMQPSLEEGIIAALNDSDPRVRLQSLLTLQHHASRDRDLATAILPRIIGQLDLDTHDQWIRMAIAVMLNVAPELSIETILTDNITINDSLMQMVALRVGQLSSSEQIKAMLQQVLSMTSHSNQTAMLRGLQEGMAISGRVPGIPSGILQRLEGKTSDLDVAIWKLRTLLRLPNSSYQMKQIKEALTETLNPLPDEDVRLRYLEVMLEGPPDQLRTSLMQLLDHRQPIALQMAAIRAIRNRPDLTLGQQIIERWPGFSASVRQIASDILIYQKENQSLLLTALEEGKLQLAEFNFDLERRRRLLFSEDTDIRDRAAVFFSDAGVVTRKEAMEEMREALELRSSVGAGSKVYALQCAQCHKFKEEGHDVGPNLTECNRMSKETLLHHILDPNAVAEPSFITHVIELHGGQTYSGILHAESSDAITLKVLGGHTQIIARNKVKKFESTGKSYMPEGLEAQIDLQEMADLIAFLQAE